MRDLIIFIINVVGVLAVIAVADWQSRRRIAWLEANREDIHPDQD